jgi:hypothetical protein
MLKIIQLAALAAIVSSLAMSAQAAPAFEQPNASTAILEGKPTWPRNPCPRGEC